MRALEQVDAWPARRVSVAVVRASGVVASRGPPDRDFGWASVTKIVTALAALVAVEEGVVDLDEPAGPPEATVRHLLAHASGLPPDVGGPITKPGRRRVYSNLGFEVLAMTVAQRAQMPFREYLRAAVLEPLA